MNSQKYEQTITQNQRDINRQKPVNSFVLSKLPEIAPESFSKR